jgi:phage terminase small subunit
MTAALTPKQEKFVQEYLIDLNATQAAIRAGYSEKTAKAIGHENLTKPDIAAAIEQAQKSLSERVEITQDWVLRNLKAVADRCMQAAPVLDRKGKPVLVENAEGDVVPAYTFNSMGANRSLELLGKHIGMFGDSLKVSGELGLTGAVSIYLPDNGRDKP